MSMFRKGFTFAISIITVIALPLTQIPAMAMEGGTEAFGSVMLPTIKEEIISVDLPTVGDESPFDFYIDPQGLLYETDGIKYGGGVVEEGAYLLFRNHNDGEYDFSRYSDRLSVTNRSTVPVIVKITAKISDIGDLRMDQDGVFDGEDDPAIYLAIVDDEGNERGLSEDGEVSVEIEMNQAPSEAYTYHYDESTDSYEYIYQSDEDISFDTYSFGLRGECNANADWRGTSACPRVMVTWSVDPVYPENHDTSDTETENDKEDIEEEAEDSSEELSETEIQNIEEISDKEESTEETTEEIEGIDNKDDIQPNSSDTKSDSEADVKPEGNEGADPTKESQTQTEAETNGDKRNTDTNGAEADQNLTGKEAEQNSSEDQGQTTGSTDATETLGDAGGTDA